MPTFTVPLHEANDCHEPAGTPAGGQFAAKGSGNCGGGGSDFATWFGGSEVVDAAGKPLRVYHATNANFDEFRSGSHFGSAQAANDRFERLYDFSVRVVKRDPGQFQVRPVYLKIENPLRMPDLADIPNPNIELDPDEMSRPPRKWENNEDIVEVLHDREVIDTDEFWEHQYDDWPEIVTLLKSKGYDGIVYKNAIEDPGHDSWIIFDPDQVRPATRK